MQRDSHSTRRQVHFPKIRPHAPNTVLTPKRSTLTFWGRVKQMLWVVGDRLKQPDIKYAVKVGMALAMLAAPAFINATRPIFTEYRGEWALISASRVPRTLRAHVFDKRTQFFVVMSPTIGGVRFLPSHCVGNLPPYISQTNFLSVHRILGTL